MTDLLGQRQKVSETSCGCADSFSGESSAPGGSRLTARTDIAPGEWDEITAAFQDANLYQTREYEEFQWRRARTEHLAVFDGGEPAAAAQVRVLEVPMVKAGIAYVYRGPIWRPRHGKTRSAAGLCAGIRALHGEYVVRRRLLLRMLPDLSADEAHLVSPVLDELGFSRTLAAPYRTFVLDLEPPTEVLRKNLAHPWRTNLNKAERRERLEVVTGTGDDLYLDFMHLYEEMAARKKFEQRVDAGKFRALQQNLPESKKMTVIVCRFEGEPVAAGVCATIGGTALQIYLATSPKALEVQGAYKLLWRQIQLLKESGATHYDLGGVDRAANPGGYQFKSGLSGKEVEFAGVYEACANPLSRAVVHGAESVRAFIGRHPALPERLRFRNRA